VYVDINISEKYQQLQSSKLKEEYLIKMDGKESSHGLKQACTIPALVLGE
jgi:hypothetical protein